MAIAETKSSAGCCRGCENFNEFSNVTTIHGFSHCIAAKSVVEKFVYVLAILLSFACIVVCLYQLGEKFVNAPSFANTEVILGNNGLALPNITICVPYRMLRQNMERVLSEFSQVDSALLLQYLNVPFRLQEFPLPQERLLETMYRMDVGCTNKNLSGTCLSEALTHLETLYSRLKLTQPVPFELASFFTNVAPRCDDIFSYCQTPDSHSLLHCCVGNNTLVGRFVTGVGTCFLYHADSTSSTQNVQTIAGPRGGYSMIFRIPKLEDVLPVIMSTNFEYGIRIYMRPVDALLERDPILASFDSKTLISVKFSRETQHPAFSTCVAATFPKSNFSFSGPYHQDTCVVECTWSTFQENCNCTEPTASFFYATSGHFTNCEPLEYIRCTQMLGDVESVIARCTKSCPVSCSQDLYFASYANAPSSKQAIQSVGKYLGTNSSTWVHIFYSELTYVAVTEYSSKDAWAIVSDVGSQLGLWLGASFISLLHALVTFIKWR